MAYREYKGNLFASGAQTLVNTVNCVGVMGKGVALEFRYRFPRMFDEYKRTCEAHLLHPGQILAYRKEYPWILNFVVKNDWRHASRIEWVESCLQKFVESYRRLAITSIALPWIGAMNGRLPWHQVHLLIRSYLSNLPDLSVELIEFDPSSPDPLYQRLITIVSQMTVWEFAAATSLTEYASMRVINSVRGQARSLSEIISSAELGKKSVASLYEFLHSYNSSSPLVAQRSLL